jgi:hypothetical protein
MFFPLSILRIRIIRDGQRKRNMFVPVLLIWVFALLLALLMLPLMAIVAIFRPRAVWAMLKTVGHFAVLFGKTRGLHVEIHNARDDILLYHR